MAVSIDYLVMQKMSFMFVKLVEKWFYQSRTLLVLVVALQLMSSTGRNHTHSYHFGNTPDRNRPSEGIISETTEPHFMVCHFV